MVEFDEVRLLIGEILQLGDRVASFGPETPLLGSIPEFDSMAVLTLIHALQEQFSIQIADDEISAATFETLGAVYEFTCQKVRQSQAPSQPQSKNKNLAQAKKRQVETERARH